MGKSPVLLPFGRSQLPEIRRVCKARTARFPPTRPRDSQPLMQSQFGRYQVIQKLGQGAMSSVFLARDPFLSRLVAVKVLHPDLLFQKSVLARFFKEAKTVSRIHSPNVVNIFDFGMEGKAPYLVMEFIDGQTLQKVMDQLQGEPMDPIVACAMMAQVVEGLGAASEWGIVHRDLKPENLMLTQRGHLKVTDFGICHLKDHTMTVTGQMLGSPRFMSPEQVDGIKPLSIQSDLFSLGGVFYYLLAGVPPFMGDTLPDLYRQILFEPHRSLSEIRPGLDRSLIRLVDALLEKDPARRGQGPSAVSTQLKKFLLKKKVPSKVDRIGEYVRELNAAGFQTTSNLNPEMVRQWMGSLELGRGPVRNSTRKTVLVPIISFLFLGLITGFVFLFSQHVRKGSPIAVSPSADSKDAPIPTVSAPVQPLVKAPLQNPIPSFTETEQADEAFSTDTIREMETSKPDIPDSIESIGQAFLTIQTAPPFAEVFLNGKLLGRTPMEQKSCPPGDYRLTLKPKLGTGVDTLIRIEPGIQSFKFVLMKNPEPEASN
jgi:serine/threonine protein kinase